MRRILASFILIAATLASALGQAMPAQGQVQEAMPYGRVVAWGDDTYHQATVPTGLNGVVAIAAGAAHSLALKNDGTVVAWGWNNSGQATVPAGLSGVVAIAAGPYHNLALKSDGTVVAWGSNYATVPSGLNGVVAIAAGYNHDLALKNDGTVVAWGNNDYGKATVPSGLNGVVAIAAGYDHNLALRNDGTVVAWGWNGFGQATVPSGLNGVVAIAAGYDHNLALKNDRTVVAWGWNDYGQAMVPVGLNGVVAIAAGAFHSLALKDDGTVVAWGGNSYGQVTVPGGLSSVVAISAGRGHSLAVVAYQDTTPPTVTSVTVDPKLVAVSTSTSPNTVSVSAVADDGSGSGIASMAFTLVDSAGTVTPILGSSFAAASSAGIYKVCATATDLAGNRSDPLCTLLAVYDPSAGFVTGGGWIDSPPGAYVAGPTLSGKASFDFVSKYQKGASIPTGYVEFQLKVANLSFESTANEWMVIAGSKAQYKGTGTVNGAGSYCFMLTAIDGQINGGGGLDKFRIKIWDPATDTVVYDNQMTAADDAMPTTVIGGGSIVIHAQ